MRLAMRVAMLAKVPFEDFSYYDNKNSFARINWAYQDT